MKSFRWNQGYYTTDDTLYPSWALSNVFIGLPNSCPNFCSGNGMCTISGCECDQGYSPPMCLPTANRPTSLTDDFSNTQIDMTKWFEVFGGSVGTLCSLPNNGNSLYFNQPGIRKAVTVDLDMTTAMLVLCTNCIMLLFVYNILSELFLSKSMLVSVPLLVVQSHKTSMK